MLIKFEADFLDVTGLLVAQEVAGTTDVEVVCRDLEAGAQRIERLQNFKPPFGLRGDRLLRRQREQRIGAQLRAPDPAAQLIELRQAEHVGAMHDQGIGGRNIETGFDDGRRQQHVVFAVVEGRHDVVQYGRRHLAVSYAEPDFRNVLVEEILDPGEILDPRRDVERLAAAIFLAQQGFTDGHRIER